MDKKKTETVCIFGIGVLYFIKLIRNAHERGCFLFKWTICRSRNHGAGMHRTGTITNDSHGWPLEGGGGTVYPDSTCVLWNACANIVNASTAQITQSSSLETRMTVTSEHHLPFPNSIPALNQFSYASCAIISVREVFSRLEQRRQSLAMNRNRPDVELPDGIRHEAII